MLILFKFWEIKMLTQKNVRVKKKVITQASCDSCGCEIGSLKILGEPEIETDLNPLHHMDGLKLTYHAGYGTEYDMSTYEIVLCTRCLVEKVFIMNKEN